jgi:hypothetical protein
MNNQFDPAKYEEEILKHEKKSPSKNLDISTFEEFEVTDGKNRDEEDIQKIE